MTDDQAARVVQTMLEAWGNRDLAATLACFADDVRYTINLDATVPFAGTSGDKPELARRLSTILDTFDFLARVIEYVTADGPNVRANSLYYYRHRASGNMLDGHNRIVCRVENHLIVTVDSYLDAPMFEAFLRLASQNAGD